MMLLIAIGLDVVVLGAFVASNGKAIQPSS